MIFDMYNDKLKMLYYVHNVHEKIYMNMDKCYVEVERNLKLCIRKWDLIKKMIIVFLFIDLFLMSALNNSAIGTVFCKTFINMFFCLIVIFLTQRQKDKIENIYSNELVEEKCSLETWKDSNDTINKYTNLHDLEHVLISSRKYGEIEEPNIFSSYGYLEFSIIVGFLGIVYIVLNLMNCNLISVSAITYSLIIGYIILNTANIDNRISNTILDYLENDYMNYKKVLSKLEHICKSKAKEEGLKNNKLVLTAYEDMIYFLLNLIKYFTDKKSIDKELKQLLQEFKEIQEKINGINDEGIKSMVLRDYTDLKECISDFKDFNSLFNELGECVKYLNEKIIKYSFDLKMTSYTYKEMEKEMNDTLEVYFSKNNDIAFEIYSQMFYLLLDLYQDSSENEIINKDTLDYLTKIHFSQIEKDLEKFRVNEEKLNIINEFDKFKEFLNKDLFSIYAGIEEYIGVLYKKINKNYPGKKLRIEDYCFSETEIQALSILSE